MQFSKDKLIAGLLFLATATIYLLFPTKNYYWDAVEFAAQIESAPVLSASLLHPNHLIYNVFGSFVFAISNAAGLELRSLYVLQMANAVLAAVSVAVLFLILKKTFGSDYLSVVLSCFFAFSATWWRFAADANAYVPSVLFLLIAFYYLLPNARPRFLLVAISHCVAMLFHQLAIFFYPVAVAGLYFQSAPSDRWRNILRYTATTGLLTFGAFVTSFYLRSNILNFPAFVRWITNYSPEVGFTFSFFGNLGYTLRGHARLFFDGRFNFFKFGANPLTTALFISLAILLGAFLFQTIRQTRFSKATFDWRKHLKPHFPLAVTCLVWAGTYLVFLFFFIPQNTFYRLFYLPALIVGFGIVFSAAIDLQTYRRRWRAALFVAMAAIANFLFFIEPYSRVRDQTPLLMALQMREIWSPQTTIYFAKSNTDNHLVKYLNRDTVWKQLDAVDLEKLTAELATAQLQNGGDVWLETSAVQTIKSTLGGEQWLANHTREESSYKLRDPAYNLSFTRIFP